MHITKINIENFKCYRGKFSLKLNTGINILVGNNEAGKSTLLEAIHLGLTGLLNGKYLKNELSQYLFNKEIEKTYLASLAGENKLPLPYILVELFFAKEDIPAFATLLGNSNSEKIDDCGVSFKIEFDEQYQREYEKLVAEGHIQTIPIEYYKITWTSFARTAVTTKSIPIKSSLIDSASVRVQNGSDIYISRIVRELLEDDEKVKISQAHRKMKESFRGDPSIQAINQKISDSANVTDKKVEISVDLSTQNAWEMSLMTYLDEIPFHHVGKGEQCIVKTNLALSHKKSQEANILLIEEPENHLSFSKLNELVGKIATGIKGKQIIISTHSSFVANKLGLEHLILLNDQSSTRLNELSNDTKIFFSKLAGYDTLRMILCKKAILVEGDSDELIVQKAYRAKNNGKLPIEDGIDIISVGTSFLRFLEVAEKINKPIAVVTDNDNDIQALKDKYADYLGENSKENIKICFDDNPANGTTLEPQMLTANTLSTMNNILEKKYTNDQELLHHMQNNKTMCALKIFDTDKTVNFPQYILDAIHYDQ